MELLEAVPEAMTDYFGEDDTKAFDGEYFSGYPLPKKSLCF